MAVSYSVILPFMGQLRDRFCVYHEDRPLADKLALAAGVEGMAGVEMVYPSEITDAGVKDLLDRHGLVNSAVNVNIKSDPRWVKGALTNPDRDIRAEAVRWIAAGMDLAAELGSDLVTVCPLADGHDYPFEINYSAAWRRLIDGLTAAADHRADVRLSIEYKLSEPRAKVMVGNVGKALYACEKIGRDNVGVTLDVGHALYAGESSAESIALLADAGRLFLVHGNDNYRNWDWDLVPGTVNFFDLLEVSYTLKQVGYDGWLAFDVFPSRVDPVEAMNLSIRMTQLADSIVERIGEAKIEETIAAADPLATLELIRAAIAGQMNSGS
jgi:xylose isomerase